LDLTVLSCWSVRESLVGCVTGEGDVNIGAIAMGSNPDDIGVERTVIMLRQTRSEQEKVVRAQFANIPL
jgi:hypothetical protein